jgi:hypothetical protein
MNSSPFASRYFFFFCLGILFFTVQHLSAAYLNRPELVDYNFAGAGICEKAQLVIKFDHEQFNAGNVFTVEIAVNGNFSGNNIIAMTGSLSQSGNQQNVYLTVSFPASVPEGNNYRLRVRGSSPLTYSSQLNEFPFSVAKLPPSDPVFLYLDSQRYHTHSRRKCRKHFRSCPLHRLHMRKQHFIRIQLGSEYASASLFRR